MDGFKALVAVSPPIVRQGDARKQHASHQPSVTFTLIPFLPTAHQGEHA